MVGKADAFGVRTASRTVEVDSYTTGGNTVDISDLVQIEERLSVSASGGYVAGIDSVDGNTVTYKLYDQTGADGDPLDEVESLNTTIDVTVAAKGF